MECSYSNQFTYTASSLGSYAPPPYDDLNAMLFFSFQGYLPPREYASQDIQRPLQAQSSFGLGVRPIDIPFASRNGAQSKFTPSPYSSPPSIGSPYPESPGISQSHISMGNNIGDRNDSSKSFHYPVMPYPRATGCSAAHATSTSVALDTGRCKSVTKRTYCER